MKILNKPDNTNMTKMAQVWLAVSTTRKLSSMAHETRRHDVTPKGDLQHGALQLGRNYRLSTHKDHDTGYSATSCTDKKHILCSAGKTSLSI